MVLQRDQPLRIWGRASAGATVKLSIDDREAETTASPEGTWRVEGPAMPAGGPYVLRVFSETDSLTFSNVMIGDVWFFSGQSNMEWPVSKSKDAEDEIAKANFPQIRLFTAPNRMAMQPQENTGAANWMVCESKNVRNFSAVAYFFGHRLWHDLRVPIGLIDASWGGTNIEAWISPESLSKDSTLAGEIAHMAALNLEAIVDSILRATDRWAGQMDSLDLGLAAGWDTMPATGPEWEIMNLPGQWEGQGLNNVDGVIWFKKTVSLTAEDLRDTFMLELGPIDDSDVTYVNGRPVGRTIFEQHTARSYPIPPGYLREGDNEITVRVTDLGYRGGFWDVSRPPLLAGLRRTIDLSGPWQYRRGTPALPDRPQPLTPSSMPTLLWNGMIAPMRGLPIRGFVWYQGEGNLGRPFRYRYRFQELILDWRRQWGREDLPFLFFQLPNFRTVAKTPGESSWATLRESQATALALPYTGMVHSIDLGDPVSIHPVNKQDFSERLFLLARAVAYGRLGAFTGPVLRRAYREPGKVILEFDHIFGGLRHRTGGEFLRAFAIAGADGRFQWAEARIISVNRVEVYHEQLKEPLYVRYAWSDNPGELDLYNGAGLPAAPFRTDTLIVPWQRFE